MESLANPNEEEAEEEEDEATARWRGTKGPQSQAKIS